MNNEHNYQLAAVVLLIVLSLGAVRCQSEMESRAYNRLTGAQTTWWDAVWLSLRVQEQPRTPQTP